MKYKRLLQIERKLLFMGNTSESKLYTYADYVTYPENERIEIIDGHIYDDLEIDFNSFDL